MNWARRATGITLLGAVLVAGGCGGGDEAETPASTSTSTAAVAPGERPGGDAPSGAPAREEGMTDVYFTSGEQFRAVARDLPAGGSAEQTLEAASVALVEGPTKIEAATEVQTATQIPAGTEVRGVSLGPDGTATVAVTAQFNRGIPGDSRERSRAEDSELDARLAQVTYTLTGIPGVRAAKVVAGGVAVEAAAERDDLARPERGPRRLERPRGERGASVRALQERLVELRYLPRSAVDGVDGYRTRQAVIAFQSWRGLERDGVVGSATNNALAKASPPSPKGDGPSRRIEVFNEKGVALLIRGDETVRAIHVSAGGPGNETPTGRYAVFRKELMSWSVPFQTWLPYASYFNNGIAFHEYPDVPTYPASHGCVRVPAPEAKGVYRFARLDTAVLVF